MSDVIDYLRRCGANQVLEASLTPAQCRELVQMHADLQIERECTSVLRDAKIEQIGLRQQAERERDDLAASLASPAASAVKALAERLREMRRSARRHMATVSGMQWSIVLSDDRLGMLSDAAQMLESLAAAAPACDASLDVVEQPTDAALQAAAEAGQALDGAPSENEYVDPDLGRLVAVHGPSCRGCAVPSGSVTCLRMRCGGLDRSDGRYVIWVRAVDQQGHQGDAGGAVEAEARHG